MFEKLPKEALGRVLSFLNEKDIRQKRAVNTSFKGAGQVALQNKVEELQVFYTLGAPIQLTEDTFFSGVKSRKINDDEIIQSISADKMKSLKLFATREDAENYEKLTQASDDFGSNKRCAVFAIKDVPIFQSVKKVERIFQSKDKSTDFTYLEAFLFSYSEPKVLNAKLGTNPVIDLEKNTKSCSIQ